MTIPAHCVRRCLAGMSHALIPPGALPPGRHRPGLGRQTSVLLARSWGFARVAGRAARNSMIESGGQARSGRESAARRRSRVGGVESEESSRRSRGARLAGEPVFVAMELPGAAGGQPALPAQWIAADFLAAPPPVEVAAGVLANPVRVPDHP